MRNFAASSILFAAPLLAQQFPEIEPNDTVGQAQVVALGSQINGAFTATDSVDWYTFTTPGGYHSLQILGDTTVSAATALDTVMDIFDSTGVTLLAWCDDSGGITVGSPTYSYVSYSSHFGEIPAGTYTVRVKPFTAATVGTYQFNLSLPGLKPYTTTEVEPNNTLATATVVGDGAQIDAAIGAATPAAYTDSVARLQHHDGDHDHDGSARGRLQRRRLLRALHVGRQRRPAPQHHVQLGDDDHDTSMAGRPCTRRHVRYRHQLGDRLRGRGDIVDDDDHHLCAEPDHGVVHLVQQLVRDALHVGCERRPVAHGHGEHVHHDHDQRVVGGPAGRRHVCHRRGRFYGQRSAGYADRVRRDQRR
jgi:hypothetical protein